MKKIVIIGGGISGLSAGIYGRLAGFETVIYEKNSVAGGQCMGWNRNEHHIDNCIHWLTGTSETSSLRKIWEEVGALDKHTTFVPTEKFYTSYLNGESITLWKDLHKTQTALIALSPKDECEIKKLIAHIRYAAKCEIPCEKPMDMMNILDYIALGKSMADMPKVTKEYGKLTMRQLADRFHHPLIKVLLTDYLPEDYNAISFIVSYATIANGNGEIPVGGSLAMTNRIIKRYKSLGGILHTNTPVKKICIKDNLATGILLENGETIKADYVLCCVDAMEAFGHLLDINTMDKKWQHAFSSPHEYPTFSSFGMAFSVDKDLLTESGTVFLDCAPFKSVSKTVQRFSLKSYEYEPSWAPKGKTVLQSNLMQDDNDYNYLKQLSKEAYKQEKERLISCITERITTAFPALKGHLTYLDCWTPLTFHRYCNAYHGAYMSFITKPNIKPIKGGKHVTGLKNVYLASQWTQSPGGLPVAVTAGKFAIQRILKAMI